MVQHTFLSSSIISQCWQQQRQGSRLKNTYITFFHWNYATWPRESRWRSRKTCKIENCTSERSCRLLHSINVHSKEERTQLDGMMINWFFMQNKCIWTHIHTGEHYRCLWVFWIKFLKKFPVDMIFKYSLHSGDVCMHRPNIRILKWDLLKCEQYRELWTRLMAYGWRVCNCFVKMCNYASWFFYPFVYLLIVHSLTSLVL